MTYVPLALPPGAEIARLNTGLPFSVRNGFGIAARGGSWSMYVRSGKTDPGIAVSFGFGVGCWPTARVGATSPLSTNAAMLTARYRMAAPWVGRANVADTSVRRQRFKDS